MCAYLILICISWMCIWFKMVAWCSG